jgi:hypothetical protein
VANNKQEHPKKTLHKEFYGLGGVAKEIGKKPTKGIREGFLWRW